MKRALLAAIALTGCYHAGVTGRFHDRPVVQAIDDRRPIPEPAARNFYTTSYLARVLLLRPIIKFFDPPKRGPAADVNAMEQVPDSTWFQNRIGARPISPEEATRGPDTRGPPQGPYELVDTKSGGGNPGFIVEDARRIRYLLKFDTAANPEQQTGTDAVVSRIFWTLGYHVPADHLIYFRRDELRVSAVARERTGLDDEDLDRLLAPATRRADGRIRASASELIAGIAKGGWRATGVRGDDPNDRVKHERRRVLRGLGVFSAWLGHTDIKEDNTLDVYVGKPGQGYLVHYLVDFGEAFGGHQSEKNQLQIGWEYAWDYKAQFKALVTFGLWKRAWEDQRPSPWKSVGYFSAEHFEPRRWRERYPYEPFRSADRTDEFWAASLIMRFDRPLLEALVATGQFTEPGAAAYLVDTLLARRMKIGAAYLDGVTPLDDIEVRDGQLCGVDLSRAYGIRSDGDLVLEGVAHVVAADGAVCASLSPAALTAGYHIARMHIRGAHVTTPALEVHYVGGPAPRVLGLIR